LPQFISIKKKIGTDKKSMCTHNRMIRTNLHFFFLSWFSLFFCLFMILPTYTYNCSVSSACSRTRLWITCNICCWNLRRKKVMKPQVFGYKLNSFRSFVLFFSLYSLIHHCTWEDVVKWWRIKRKRMKPFIFERYHH